MYRQINHNIISSIEFLFIYFVIFSYYFGTCYNWEFYIPSILVHVITICFLFNNHLYNCLRVIDVGSEWRTFSNEKGGEDRSRVGGPENTLLGSSDLTTMIGRSECRLTRFVWLCSGGLFWPSRFIQLKRQGFSDTLLQEETGVYKVAPLPPVGTEGRTQ